MSDIKITRGIPLPPRGRATKYPWAAMEVGDSFPVAGNKCGTATTLAITANKRYAPKSFIHGKYEGECRVWRTA